MCKYLVYDDKNNLIKVVDDNSGYKNKKTFVLQSGHNLTLYYADSAKGEITPIVSYLTQELNIGLFKLLSEAKGAVEQLVAIANQRSKVLFLFLGASPKVVKWAMKKSCEGGPHEVRSLSVSGLSNAKQLILDIDKGRWEQIRHEPTTEFTKYLKTKLKGIEDKDAILLLDFASTGASLERMKEDVEALLSEDLNKVGVSVFKVAVGNNLQSSSVGDLRLIKGMPILQELMKGTSNNYKAQVKRHRLLKDYPTLKKHGTIKEMIGRRSTYNAYRSWSEKTRSNKKDTSKETLQKFNFFKSIFRSASSDEVLAMIENVTKPISKDMQDK